MFSLVFLGHEYLVIARIGIQKAHQLAARGYIHALVNAREWEVVLGGCFVGVVKSTHKRHLPVVAYQDGVG